jgi:hypothetical protein
MKQKFLILKSAFSWNIETDDDGQRTLERITAFDLFFFPLFSSFCPLLIFHVFNISRWVNMATLYKNPPSSEQTTAQTHRLEQNPHPSISTVCVSLSLSLLLSLSFSLSVSLSVSLLLYLSLSLLLSLPLYLTLSRSSLLTASSFCTPKYPM